MSVDRVKFQDIVASQLPRYVKEDFPLFTQFLEQYYVSQEIEGGVLDILQNMDQYVKVEQLVGMSNSSILASKLSLTSKTVTTSAEGNFTDGFVDNNGIIMIDDEIIFYSHKTETTFEGCVRGFSGITSYTKTNAPDELEFKQTAAARHDAGSTIVNLNVLFLQEFLRKIKAQFAPGFTERTLAENLDQKNFIYNADSFYKSKGTDTSFKILFGALYGKAVEVIKPSEYLIRPSNADYKVTRDFVVQSVYGDVFDLKNRTLYQDSSGARGTVSNVDRINYGDGSYYNISIDFGYPRDIDVDGTIFGEFVADPITKLLNNIKPGATIIDVDSTVSFPESGSLVTKDIDNNNVILSYESKSVDQFIGVTGILNTLVGGTDVHLNQTAYAKVGPNAGDRIEVRVSATLTDLQLPKTTRYLTGDKIIINNFGYEGDDERLKNWNYNVKSKFNVESIELVDITEDKYRVKTFDKIRVLPGYQVLLENDKGSFSSVSAVLSVNSAYEFILKVPALVNVSDTFTIENQTLKGNSSKYTNLNSYIANVQNTYVYNERDLILVASNSIPNYYNIQTNPNNKKITLNGLYSGVVIEYPKHGFYSGDAVYYQPKTTVTEIVSPDGIVEFETTVSKFDDLDEGVYYIKRVSRDRFSLSRSKGDLFANKFITIFGDVVDNQFIYFNFYNKVLSPQKILRTLTSVNIESRDFPTDPGYVGILNNGVEILNYKSADIVYYGEIEQINLTSSGGGYDIITPPEVMIVDEVGYGATGTASVTGSLERIEIVEPGFDYQDVPIVRISGGNGKDAAAKANMLSTIHFVNFNAEQPSGIVSITDNTLGFTTFHKFRNGEEVVYDSRGLLTIGGISTNSHYYAGVVDPSTISLHSNQEDAISGINTIQLTSFGSGLQAIKSAKTRNIVSSIIVTNSGSGYSNKKRQISTTGVSTALNSINILNHGFQNKEIVQYSGTSVEGLSSTKNYYVVKIDDDNFSLTDIGTGTTATDAYYQDRVLVDLKSTGTGFINYPPIEVSVEGVIGVHTTAGQDFRCKVQPIFRGSIGSVDLTNNGVGYGASEIMNFDRQPNISFLSGSKALLTAIINNGSIVDVLVTYGGKGYNSPPDLVIESENGTGAVLTPIVRNGVVAEVRVIKGGAGYVQNKTNILVVSAGREAKAVAKIKQWTVNLFERDFENIQSDDGFVNESLDNQSLQYSHMYPARALRESTFAIRGTGKDNTAYGTPDLIKSGGNETDSKFHSPILGWAYDGNPIYGPYGFSNIDGTGQIRRMVSGYENQTASTNRPQFETGFFVEDYIFTGRGDLDEHNGRYCVTPDFPNGTYAYFMTINNAVDSGGPFNDYKRPIFPYVIGNTYQATPILSNFLKGSNQTDFDLQTNTWLRYTPPYHMNGKESQYDYIFNSNQVKKQIIDITYATNGGVESVGIVTGGDAYKVRDTLVFNNTESGGTGAAAQVTRIGGKSVDTVSVATTSLGDVEFIPLGGRYLGIATAPHNLASSNRIQVSGVSSYFAGFDGSYTVGVTSTRLSLVDAMGATATTGIVTHIRVSGPLTFPSIISNDVLLLEDEKVKVLNIDTLNSRLRVLREYDGTTGVAHTATTPVVEQSRKLSINVGSITTTRVFDRNKEIYFIPEESVGLGTVTGTGIGNTLSIANPGAGQTQVFVKPNQIYFPGHGFKLNEVLDYSTNGGTSIQVWNGDTDSSYQTLESVGDLYAVPITPETFSLSGNKVGLGTQGSYVGVGTDGKGLLYFTNAGVGNTHSFTTRRENVLIAEVDQNIVTVSTASTHGLSVGDRIFMDVNPRDTIDVDVRYNDYNRRIVFNPLSFVAGDVNTNLNTIVFSEGDFETGDKVIYTTTSAVGGLTNQKMYYVVKYNRTDIRLVENQAELSKEEPKFVQFSSVGSGTLSKINPPVTGERGNTINFNLSDSSLAFIFNGVSYSAFDLNLYTDAQFLNEFLATGDQTSFEVKKTGRVGIDTFAFLSLSMSDTLPQTLYYEFSQPNFDFNPDYKNLVIDKDVTNYQQINVTNTPYNGLFNVSGIGNTTFEYNIDKKPRVEVYGRSNSAAKYETDSKTANGPISKVTVTNTGYNYRTIPGITSVRSGAGNSAILLADSSDIGSVKSSRFNDIGFNYPTDNTVRVTANPPEIIEVESLYSIDEIGITSAGRNYLIPAELVCIDGYTNKVIPEVQLDYELGDTQVSVLRNVFNLYDVEPRIVPTQNSNGLPISNIVWNDSTNVVRVTLDKTYQVEDEFEYKIGDMVMIENISVGVGTTGVGFNSRDYGYRYFRVTAIDKKAGGSGAYIEYSLEDTLKEGDVPGNYDPARSFGRVINTKDLVTFRTTLKQNDLLVGEIVTSGANRGRIERWDPNSGYLFISSTDDFEVGDIVVGQTSGTFVTVQSKLEYYTEVLTGAGATVINGWQTNSGVLNDDLQRIPNNEYYQNFSYSLKSEIPFETWNEPVGTLDHTAGFEKFADLDIISSVSSFRESVVPVEDGVELTIDILSIGNVNCYGDFDTGTEVAVEIGDIVVSKEINLDSKILTDYYESVGNRVLDIDDISYLFNNNSRPTPYSQVSEYSLGNAYNKIFTFIEDDVYQNEVQAGYVTLLQKDSIAYMQEYATIDSGVELGSFDYLVPTDNEDKQFFLLFYPVKSEYNNYSVSTFNSALLPNNVGVGTQQVGEFVTFKSLRTTVQPSTPTTIVSMASTIRSGRMNVLVDDGDDYGATELTFLRDNSNNVYISEYGKMQTHEGLSSGFGTFYGYVDGSVMKIDFTPNPDITEVLEVDSTNFQIANNTVGNGIGTFSMNVTKIEAQYQSFASSPSPTESAIATFQEPDEACAFLVSIEDTTNSEYELVEVVVLDSPNGQFFVEYNNLQTSSGLGTFGVSKTSDVVSLNMTPVANANVEVKTLSTTLRRYDDNSRTGLVDLGNTNLIGDYGTYTGTLLDLKTTFDITHRGEKVFQRTFDGSNASIVDVSNNSVTIPNHFFVTGEEIDYRPTGTGSTSAIPIASTNIPGVGVTDKLPSSVFVVRDGDLKIKFAGSAADALAENPVVLDFTGVGIGTIHKFTAKNQNTKCLIAIDNMIQTPVVSSGVTATLTNNLVFETNFEISGITSIKSNDLLEIGDEIMLVTDTGIGGPNFVSVRRAWMGTQIAAHGSNALVTKLDGNYNITNNTLNFAAAPVGQTPLSTTASGPDNVDWSGISTSSTFQGRVFMRSGEENGSQETYAKNYIFDDISGQFTGVQSSFVLKSNGQDVTTIAQNNSAIILVNGIYQEPDGIQNNLVQQGDYSLEENGGETTILFTGSDIAPEGYDPNKTGLPLGGLIVSVGSTEGFGYQPLVGAGATVTVGAGGTIAEVSIGNSGSGYRSGIQTVVNVGVQTSSTGTPNIEFIGTAAIQGGHIVSIAITNPGSGYDSSNPPKVVIDEPLPYSNIPLIYSSDSVVGGGVSATIDIVVGQGSSVIDFVVQNQGFGYGNDQILTVEIGGTTGIPTTGSNFREFQISVDDIYSDSFNGWSVGSFQVLDKLDKLFDGTTKSFRLKLDNNIFSAQNGVGSNVDVEQTFLVFINNILQDPKGSYRIRGGSLIEFDEAPSAGDTSKILFYQGSGLDVDVIFRDIVETVKPGDTLRLMSDATKGQGPNLNQNDRVVTGISTVDTVTTTPYATPEPGITTDRTLSRPVEWCKQVVDRIIDGRVVGKDREEIEPEVNPTAFIIQSVGIGSTTIYVDTLRPIFDPNNEATSQGFQNKITVTSQDVIAGASATAVVSTAGTVTDIIISDGGRGYTSNPSVTIGVPAGLGTSYRATATAALTLGSVTSISVTGGGSEYSQDNPPMVLIEEPVMNRKNLNVETYDGDYGVLVGFGTTTTAGQDQVILDFFVPYDSFMRENRYAGVGNTVSGIGTGDYFTLFGTNIGITTFSSLKTKRNNGSDLGITSSFLDCTYQVQDTYLLEREVVGVGVTFVRRVFSNIGGISSISFSGFGGEILTFDSAEYTYDSRTFNVYTGGISTSRNFGSYSWGRIDLTTVVSSELSAYTDNGYVGLSTGGLVTRTNPLKYKDYVPDDQF